MQPWAAANCSSVFLCHISDTQHHIGCACSLRNGCGVELTRDRSHSVKLRTARPMRRCACRLKMDQMEAVFDRRRRLLPRPSDLSYYNWDTQMSSSNASPNFQVGGPLMV